jgi:parallel beta-helix repeat protein
VKASQVLFLVFVIMVSLWVVNTQPVKSQSSGTIYIRADGSVEGTDKIQRDGNVYTFTYNIFDQTIVVKKDNIVVDGAGFTLQGAGAYHPEGIDLLGRSNVTIKNIRVSNTHYGILLDESFNNSIVGNYITDNSNIALYSSSNNNVTGNNIINNQGNGIYFVDSSKNSISGNNITNNNSGIWLERSSNNTISRNNVINNYNGIWCMYASNNIIYHNNFINNYYQVFDVSMESMFMAPSVNIWDDGYPSGGNYWGDYEARYPNATELDDSGLWDTPYALYGNNQDNYPLMHPLVAPPLLDNTPPTISVVSPENKTYTVKDVPLTFTVSEPASWIRYSLDGQANVTIAGNTTLTGLSDGPHSLVVYAKDVAGNTGASERTFFSKVTPPPDLNGEIFLITNWIFWGMIIITVIGAALLVYFRKIRKTRGKTEIISEGAK